MALINHKDFKEIFRQITPIAQEINQIANGDMLWHRDKFAAHQTAGGFFWIGEGGLNRDPVFRVQLCQNGALVFLVQILDQLNRVVRFQLLGDLCYPVSG